MNQSPNYNLLSRFLDKPAKFLGRDFYELEGLQSSKRGPASFAKQAYERTKESILHEYYKTKDQYSVEIGGEVLGSNDLPRIYFRIIDGFDNFIRSFHDFATAAYLINNKNECLAALIHTPAHNKVYFAEKNQGIHIYSNGPIKNEINKARVSETRFLWEAKVGLAVSKKKSRDIIFDEPKLIKSTGSYFSTNCEIADIMNFCAGKYDFLVTSESNVAEEALKNFLVREAGGFFIDQELKNNIINSDGVNIACSPSLMSKISKL